MAVPLLYIFLLAAAVAVEAAVTPTALIPPSTTAFPLPRECPAGARVFPSTTSCYWVVRQAMTWSQAERDCVRRGGKLASVESDDENEFLYDYTRSFNLSSPTFWLGMLNKNTSSPAAYSWHDGVQPRNGGVYKNFMAREARSLPEMCMTMWSDYTQADGSWQQWNCAHAGYAGVCKKKYRSVSGDLRSTVSPLEDSIQANRCCTHCGKGCASNERCIPDDLDCLIRKCPGDAGYGWCLPAKEKN